MSESLTPYSVPIWRNTHHHRSEALLVAAERSDQSSEGMVSEIQVQGT